MDTRNQITRRIDQLRWTTLGVAIALGSMVISQSAELQQAPNRFQKIRLAMPIRSLLTVSMRIPSALSLN